jgi:hypothetical protein
VPAGGSGGSGGSATGTAGGDLSGTYPDPTVAAVHATGGTLDGVTIGGTTPGVVNTTSLKATNPTTATGGNTDPGSGSMELTGTIFRGSSAYNYVLSDNISTSTNGLGQVAANINETLTSNLTTTAFATTRIFTAQNAADCVVNSNDDLGGLFGETYSTIYIGSCTHAGLQNFYYAIVPSSGKQGSIVPISEDNGPSFRNLLDDGSGNGSVQGQFSSGSYMGPATAPTGSCSTSGAWVFSQDGHATFCAGGTWVMKI